MAGIQDEVLKEGFARLPASARHAISAACYGALLVGFFFLWVRDPLTEAHAADMRQDAAQERQQQSIEQLKDLVTGLTQIQAVQTSTVANLQRNQDHTDKTLDRLEEKIDKLRQGR